MPATETAFVIQGAAKADAPPHYLVEDAKGRYWSEDQGRAKRFISAVEAKNYIGGTLRTGEYLVVFAAFQVKPVADKDFPNTLYAPDTNPVEA